MIRTVFERTWRSESRWKRRFYARYMTWLERIGYAVVLLLLGGGAYFVTSNLLTVIVVVVIVLALGGYFGRGRMR